MIKTRYWPNAPFRNYLPIQIFLRKVPRSSIINKRFLFISFAFLVFVSLSNTEIALGITSSPQGGNYLDLNTNTKYLTAPDDTSLDVADQSSEELTLEAWIYAREIPAPAGSGEVLIAGKLGAYEIYLTSMSFGGSTYASIKFLIPGVVAMTRTLPFASPLNAWHHIALSIQRSSIYNKAVILYSIDGDVSASSIYSILTLSNTALPFAIGGPNDDDVAYNGAIDEVRISSVARYPGTFNHSSSFTAVDFTLPSSAFTTDGDTRALWHFDESTYATSFADSSANGNTLSVFDTITFDLLYGWNGVSVPGVPVVGDWSTIIAGNSDISMVVEYDPTQTKFVMATNIEFGKSYFVGALNDTQIELEYLAKASLSSSPGSGWNPLGSVSCSIPASNVTSDPQVSMVVRWDNGDGVDQFVMASTIDSGVGYMVACLDDCTIGLDCLSLAPSIQRFVMKPSWEGMLSVQTQTDHKKLAFGMNNAASDGADLYDRPVPPMLDMSDITAGWVIENSCFDLFEESFVRDNEYANWELSVDLAENGKISWGNLPRGCGFTLSYDGVALDMHRERSLSLPIGKHTLLISANSNNYIPEKTELLASYPNPCNPETWIPYKLSRDADARIMIYSSNGALVRSLNLGHRHAGVYVDRSKAAYWDGKNESGENVSSGVYFYNLVIPEFSETRKLLIIR